MKILVFSGGYSNEREVSLRSGKAVRRALELNGHEVVMADTAEDLDWEHIGDGVEVAFIALHGAGDEDGVIQAQLEKVGLPYTGSGIASSDLCWDKWAYKEFLSEKQIPLTRGVLVNKKELDSPYFTKPFVLKPIRGGSTLDTLIVRHVTEDKLSEAEKLLDKYNTMLVEELVEGIEITVPVLGDKALPVIEIIPPKDKDFDYENKYNGATSELCPPENVNQAIQAQAQALAQQIHNLTGCRDMSRTDMIIGKNGNLHVLETNTIPGMTDTSLLPKSAAVAGMDMPSLCQRLVDLALRH